MSTEPKPRRSPRFLLRPSPSCLSSCAQGKKKQFIDRAAESTAHFQIVHRSQRDPLAADPDAPQRVLLPAEIGQRKGTSDRASQSTRAWLEEQDLAGFEALTGRPTAAGRRSEDFADFAVAPNDDYDYGQHLLPIKGDGVFIPRTELLGPSGGGSSAGGRGARSVAGSSASRLSRLSRASITLRNVAGVSDAFASAEELAVAVGGASNGLEEEEEESLVRAEMGEELWALLQTDGPKDASILEEEEGGEGADGTERPNEDETELEDDFVIKAALPIVPSRRRRPKRQQHLPEGTATVRPVGEESEEGVEGLEGEEDEEGGEGEEGEEGEEDEEDEEDEEGEEGEEGEEDEEDEEDEEATMRRVMKAAEAAAVRQQAAMSAGVAVAGPGPKRINPFKELFPSDSEEEEEEAKAAAGNSARGGAARGGGSGAKSGAKDGAKKVNPFKELFPSDSEEEGEGEGDEESELGSRMEKVSVRGRAVADGRLLDARFEQLLADEYSDGEIGELDPDDPRLAGPAGLEAFDGVLDEYLHAQRTKKLEYVKVLGDGASREWARLPAHERQPVPHGSGVVTGVDAGADAAGVATAAVDCATASVALPSSIDRLGNGVEATDEVSDSDDDSIEENPFFEALKEGYRKEREWDAETILSTYSTTENHPTLVRCARKPAKGKEGIQLDRRTGLPVGLMLPAEEERRRKAIAEGAEEAGGNEDDERSEGAVEVFNAGAARPKDESKEEKRQRKAEAKAAQAARRTEKKATKTAFREERTEVAKAKHSTTQLPGQQSLSRW